MIAEETDIHFECSQCGQPISVDRSGAGRAANCPNCSRPLMVPHVSSHTGGLRESTRLIGAGLEQASLVEEEPTIENGYFATEEQQNDLAPEEIGAGSENELAAARQKIARLQQHLRKALEDCERLTASATHFQAEKKSVQNESLQLRQRIAVWEAQVSDGRAKITELASALATAGSEHAFLKQEYESQRAQHQDYQAKMESHVAAYEDALNQANARIEEHAQTMSAAGEEIHRMHREREAYVQELEAAHRQIDEGTRVQQLLLTTEESLREEKECAVETETRCVGLQASVDALRLEVEDLKRNLDMTTAGRELLELRTRFEALDAEHKTASAALVEKETNIKVLNATLGQMKAELKKTRDLQEDAERRADAAAESKVQKDNELLRGIVDRQNVVLGENSRELRQLRRGRFGMRTAYVLASIALMALVAFALALFKPQLAAHWGLNLNLP